MATDQAITDTAIPVESDATPTPEVTSDAPASMESQDVSSESPEVTIPFTLPDALRTPEPTTQGRMSEVEQQQLLSRNEELERRQEDNLQVQSRNQQATAIHTRAQGYLSTMDLSGLTSEQLAQWAATEVEKAVSDGRSATEQVEGRSRSEVARRRSAVEVGLEFNVSPDDLMSFNSKTLMQHEAKWIVRDNKHSKDIAGLQKDRVPNQPFVDGAQGAGGGTRFTQAQIADMTPEQYKEARPYLLGEKRS